MKSKSLLLVLSFITLGTNLAFQPVDADPKAVIRQLKRVKNATAKRSLILQLGGFSAQQLPTESQQSLLPLLLTWYHADPDPGVHSAIDWLLRYSEQGSAPRALDWQQAAALATIDQKLMGKPAVKRNWYVNKQGHTLAILRGPIEFQMGSPAIEGYKDEGLHAVQIPRSFAIATKELTVAQFQRFLEAHPEVLKQNTEIAQKDPRPGSKSMKLFSPESDCPQILVNWYELAQYCNWLSEQDGMPESEWCYPTYSEIKSGMQLPANYLQRTGYRMPTEAEWEYACRAGTTTNRFYGSDTTALKDYAWYLRTPATTGKERTWPVGQLKPNPWGLFDVYGNVWEWCQDRRTDYPAGSQLTEDKEDSVLTVTDTSARTRRGGSFVYDVGSARSAHRGVTNYLPQQRRDNVGVRVARTYR